MTHPYRETTGLVDEPADLAPRIVLESEMLPPNEGCRVRVVSTVRSAPGMPRASSIARGTLVRHNIVEVALSKDCMGQWIWMSPPGGWPMHALETLAQHVKETR
jgi:hypothetical protein